MRRQVILSKVCSLLGNLSKTGYRRAVLQLTVVPSGSRDTESANATKRYHRSHAKCGPRLIRRGWFAPPDACNSSLACSTFGLRPTEIGSLAAAALVLSARTRARSGSPLGRTGPEIVIECLPITGLSHGAHSAPFHVLLPLLDIED